MNKLRYRVIFSAARGMLVAVQETARSAGKAAGTTAGAIGAVGVTAAALLATSPAQAQIAGDPSAPGNQRPTVLAAPNGVPIVNVTTPSAAGVSRNVYRQFDVNGNGAILNNSRTAVQSQLGGYIAPNPWLARGSARVILNEVNSSSPSYLRGYVEVAGPKADVIIANPSGIQVQGGGFINSSRVTLTTGVPQLNAYGGIESYRVTGGSIGVSGNGLDFSGTEFAALYARMVSINGGVWGGGELRVVTGANQVGADGAPGVAAYVAPIAGTGPAQPLAFDVGALGGMYAQKIWIMGTAAGVGARNAGTIQTGAGDAKLMGLGELTVTAAGHIENIGTTQAAGAAVITAPTFANSGKVVAAGSTKIATQGDLTNAGGTIEGQRVELASASGDLINTQGTIRQTSMVGLTLAAPTLVNTNGGTVGYEPAGDSSGTGPGMGGGSGGGGTSTGGNAGGGSTGGATDPGSSGGSSTDTAGGDPAPAPAAPIAPGVITAAGAIRNEGGHIYAGGPIELQTPNVSNAGGKLEVASLAVTGPTFSNAGGTLNVTNGFSANVSSFDNNNGKLQAGSLDIATTGDLLNQDGTLASNNDASVNVGGLVNNQRGTISATGALDARATGAIQNASGSLLANQTVAIQGRSLDNTLGMIASAAANTSLSIADALTNSGQIRAATDLAVRAGSMSNAGSLRAGNDASVVVADVLTNDGSITAGRNASISATSLQGGSTSVLGAGINADGSVGTTGDLNISTTRALVAQGTNLAVGDASLRASIVDLSASHTNAANLDITATEGDVTTNGATVATAGALSVAAGQTIANDRGTLNAGQLDLRASNLINTNGGEIGQTGTGAARIVVAGVIDNTKGTIASNGDMTIEAGAFGNQGGVIQAAGTSDLVVTARGLLDNSQQGQIVAGGDATLQADTLTNDSGRIAAAGSIASITSGATSNEAGTIVANGNLALSAATFTNKNGSISAVRDASIVVAQADNASGLVAAGGQLKLADQSGANLQLDNTGGQVIGVGGIDLGVSASTGSGAGKVLSDGDIWLHGAADWTNGEIIQGGGNISLDFAGTLTNNGTLSAGETLTAKSRDLINNAGAAINGNRVELAAQGTLTNNGAIEATDTLIAKGTGIVNGATGLLSSGDHTYLLATGGLTNSGTIDGEDTQVRGASITNTSRIYGTWLSVGDGASVVNEAGAVIAARSYLDLGATSIVNRGELLSEGGMTIAGRLDGSGIAVGQAATLRNESALISANGNMSLHAADLQNIDTHLTVERTTTTRPTRTIVTVAGIVLPEGSVAMPAGAAGTPDGRYLLVQHADGSFIKMGPGYSIQNIGLTVTEDHASNALAARILAGGDIDVDGRLTNRDSQVLAGGTFTANAPVSNLPTMGNRTESGTSSLIVIGINPNESGDLPLTTTPINNQLPSFALTSWGAPSGGGAGTNNQVPGANGGGATPGGGSGNPNLGGGGAGDPNFGGGDNRPFFEVPGSGSLVVRTSAPRAGLPNSSLFNVRPGGAGGCLVETHPRYANYRNWLSSDYLLNALSFDPSSVQKRLGDGYYEQHLIREQVAQLTGSRFLEGFNSDEEEYVALMNAGVTFAQKFQLTPGIALTAEQMARLTSDIVWLVSQTVTLPDGSTQTVLVPQVYVRVKPGDIDGTGTLLSADKVRINAAEGAGDIINKGTIAGRSVVELDADNVRNLDGGRITGGSVKIDARQDIDNIGSTIEARKSLTLDAGRDVNVITTTTTRQTALAESSTTIDRVAGLYVTGAGGSLQVDAGRDINLTSAIVANRDGANPASESGLTRLSAERDLNLGTVTESQTRTDVLAGGYVAQGSSRETGTMIASNGTTVLGAGRDINARQADVNAGDGLLVANAGRDLNITDGQSKDSSDYLYQSTKKGTFSSTTTKISASEANSKSVGSSFQGGLVSLQADNNVNIVGSHISGTQGVSVTASNELNVVEGRNTHDSSASFSRTKTTKVLASPTFSKTTAVGNTIESHTDDAAASSITSRQGGIHLGGGNSVYLRGAQVSADKDVTIKGGDVTIVAAVNEASHSVGESSSSRAGVLSIYHGLKSKSESTQDAEATSLARSTLQGGNVSITATGDNGTSGALSIAGTTIDTPGTLKLEGDSVNLALQSTEATTSHTSGKSNLVWQSTKDSGTVDETLHYNQINAGSLEVNANRVTVGMNAKDSVEALAQQPGMGWIGQMNSDPALAGKIDWQKIEEAHKQWDYGKSGLTPEGAAVVTAIVTWVTWGPASGLGAGAGDAAAVSVGQGIVVEGATFAAGSTVGAVVSGAVAAGVSALAAQASIALINNQGDIGAALKDLGSSSSVKNLLTAIATGGVLGGLSMNPTGLPTTAGGADKFMSQLGDNLTAGAAKAVIGTAINGGSLEDALKEGFKTAFLDTIAAQGAFGIGSNIEPGSVANALAHAIAGCAVGAARTGGSCTAGALGAAIGELAASLYDPGALNTQGDTVQFAAMMSSIAGAIAGLDATEINQASQAGANSAANNWLATKQVEQAKKELAEAKTPLEALQVAAKWAAVGVKQDVLTASGISLGLVESGISDIKGLADFLAHPIEGLDGIRQLIGSTEAREQLGNGLFKELDAKIGQMQTALTDGGDQNAVQLGQDLGSLIWQVGSALTGAGAVAKGGVALANVAVKVGTGALDAALGITVAKAAAMAGAGTSVPATAYLGAQARVSELMALFNKEVGAENLSLSGKTFTATTEGNKAGTTKVFNTTSLSDAQLEAQAKAYVNDLTGGATLTPVAGNPPNVWTATLADGTRVNLRSVSTSSIGDTRSQARWTIDIKGNTELGALNPANRANNYEIKFK